MEIDLSDVLEEYKRCTLELINCIEREDYDLLESLLNKRQKILDEFNNSNYTKDKLSETLVEFKILDYEKKLNNLITEKKDKVKENLNRLSQNKKAINMYNKRSNGAKVFVKKI